MSTETRGQMHRDEPAVLQTPPPLTSKIVYSIILYAGKGLVTLSRGFQKLKEVIWPPNFKPDIIKAYQCRPHLPVRCVKPLKSPGMIIF